MTYVLDFPDIHTHRIGAGNASGFCLLSCTPDEFVAHGGEYYSVGIHPWQLTAAMPPEETWHLLEEAVRHPQVLAVGEAGVDKLAAAPLPLQETVFERQALLAEETDKPLVIHLVKAVDELLRVRKRLLPRVPWVVHGFRGKAALAQELLHHGFYLSFGEKYQEGALNAVPLSRLFLETDESLESISRLYVRAAAVRQLSVEELVTAVRDNVYRVFRR